MIINTSIPAFAQNNFSDTAIQNETNFVGNIIVTEDGVTINGVYYTKAEFTNLLNQAVAISDSKNEDTDSRVGIAAGIYFIPVIGQVAIAATGVIIVAGTVLVAGSWLYNTITKWLSNFSSPYNS